jgi:hypothetical protein
MPAAGRIVTFDKLWAAGPLSAQGGIREDFNAAGGLQEALQAPGVPTIPAMRWPWPAVKQTGTPSLK